MTTICKKCGEPQVELFTSVACGCTPPAASVSVGGERYDATHVSVDYGTLPGSWDAADGDTILEDLGLLAKAVREEDAEPVGLGRPAIVSQPAGVDVYAVRGGIGAAGLAGSVVDQGRAYEALVCSKWGESRDDFSPVDLPHLSMWFDGRDYVDIPKARAERAARGSRAAIEAFLEEDRRVTDYAIREGHHEVEVDLARFADRNGFEAEIKMHLPAGIALDLYSPPPTDDDLHWIATKAASHNGGNAVKAAVEVAKILRSLSGQFLYGTEDDHDNA